MDKDKYKDKRIKIKIKIFKKQNKIFSHQERNPAICTTQMDLDSIMLSEISQKERQILYGPHLLYNLKTNSQKQITDWQLPEEGSGDKDMAEWGQKI